MLSNGLLEHRSRRRCLAGGRSTIVGLNRHAGRIPWRQRTRKIVVFLTSPRGTIQIQS
jgi:hypothetical protein